MPWYIYLTALLLLFISILSIFYVGLAFFKSKELEFLKSIRLKAAFVVSTLLAILLCVLAAAWFTGLLEGVAGSGVSLVYLAGSGWLLTGENSPLSGPFAFLRVAWQHQFDEGDFVDIHTPKSGTFYEMDVQRFSMKGVEFQGFDYRPLFLTHKKILEANILNRTPRACGFFSRDIIFTTNKSTSSEAVYDKATKLLEREGLTALPDSQGNILERSYLEPIRDEPEGPYIVWRLRVFYPRFTSDGNGGFVKDGYKRGFDDGMRLTRELRKDLSLLKTSGAIPRIEVADR